MEGLIEGVAEKDFILGVLMNIESGISKAKRQRLTNAQFIEGFLLARTSKSGRTSVLEQCKLLGLDPDAKTVYAKGRI